MALAMTHPSRVRSIVVADVAPVKYQWTEDDPLSVPSVVRVCAALKSAATCVMARVTSPLCP